METRNTKTTKVILLKKGDILSASNSVVMEDPYTDTSSPKGTCYISIKYSSGEVKLQTWKRNTTVKIYDESGTLTFDKPMRQLSQHFTPFICKQLYAQGISFVEEAADMTDEQLLSINGLGKKFIWKLRDLMTQRNLVDSNTVIQRKRIIMERLRIIEGIVRKTNDLNTITLAMIELDKLTQTLIKP